ncbi:MAG: class I SAM-dependent methyltransferase [Pseudomonadota bacterium]|nr:class I SAM-dependent methyltransferase [Pseudomonadota bacterium]
MRKAVKVAAIEDATRTLERFNVLHSHNWWNHMRLSLVQYVLDQRPKTKDQRPKTKDQRPKDSLLDFGCGKGIQLAQLKKSHPFISYAGYEPYLISKQVDSSIPLFRSLSDLAGRKFDFITALDVIEHIEGDLQALREMHSLLTEHGVVLIHVPAYMHLWSAMDFLGGHYRRYTKRNLMAVVKQAGFTVVEIFYITPFAYPAYLLRKYVYQVLAFFGSNQDVNTFTDNVPIDPLKIPSMLVALELALIKKTKLRSPFGSSLFCYATKAS